MTVGADHLVWELRQYTVTRGLRDHYAAWFDRGLVAPQEEVGIRVVAQFHDLDDPDRFVWMRSFEDMGSRLRALTEFYDTGEAWRTHGRWASDLVTDWSAMLLRPVLPFVPSVAPRARVEARQAPVPCFHATICFLDKPVDEGAERIFANRIHPALAEAGAEPIGCFRTEYAEDHFTQMPTLSNVNILVWFCSFADLEQCRAHTDSMKASPGWRGMIENELSNNFRQPPTYLHLGAR